MNSSREASDSSPVHVHQNLRQIGGCFSAQVFGGSRSQWDNDIWKKNMKRSKPFSERVFGEDSRIIRFADFFLGKAQALSYLLNFQGLLTFQRRCPPNSTFRRAKSQKALLTAFVFWHRVSRDVKSRIKFSHYKEESSSKGQWRVLTDTLLFLY